MSPSDIAPELVEAYRRTEYRVFVPGKTVTLHIGEPSPDMAAEIDRARSGGAVFITAENPFSRPSRAAENAARQVQLRDELIALGSTIFEGIGQGEDASWPGETSYAAIGISRDQACALGRKFEQNAIVWIGRDGTPELVLLR